MMLVGRGERVRITQIDLVLAWTRLMMRVFHRNAHLFEHVDGGGGGSPCLGCAAHGRK